MPQHVVFDYRQHRLCGGRAQIQTSLGPRPETHEPLIEPDQPQEGRYLTREGKAMGAATFLANLAWARRQAVPLPQSTLAWLEVHRVGPQYRIGWWPPALWYGTPGAAA